jgi:F420H(2)-dependent quinone reductase
MAKYVPSPRDWVRDQVELYESSGGTKGTTLRDTGLPVVIVTHRGNKTGAIRKTPLMRVKEGDNYILVGSQGERRKIRPGYTTCAPISISSFAMRPSYARCACVRSRTRRKGLVCGHWPWRYTRHTRNIRRARNVKFRSLSPSLQITSRAKTASRPYSRPDWPLPRSQTVRVTLPRKRTALGRASPRYTFLAKNAAMFLRLGCVMAFHL